MTKAVSAKILCSKIIFGNGVFLGAQEDGTIFVFNDNNIVQFPFFG